MGYAQSARRDSGRGCATRHRRLDAFVTQQFLDGANVVVALRVQQVGGEGVSLRRGFALADGVGRDPFGDACLLGSFLDGFLQCSRGGDGD